MVTEEIKARYRRSIDAAFNKGNIDAWDEILAPDVIVHEPTNTDVIGLEAYKQEILAQSQGFTERFVSIIGYVFFNLFRIYIISFLIYINK